MTTRADIIACARSWIGTPFHECESKKGLGADCAGLIMGVAREVGLFGASWEVPNYTQMPDGVTILRLCREYADEVAQADAQPGDVVVLKSGVHPQHMGFLTNYKYGGLAIVHATSQSTPARVIETRLMYNESMRFVAAFTLRGVI
jgi:cell wall-associated NlpC family hydrolase